jgi:hypothetical protein
MTKIMNKIFKKPHNLFPTSFAVYARFFLNQNKEKISVNWLLRIKIGFLGGQMLPWVNTRGGALHPFPEGQHQI